MFLMIALSFVCMYHNATASFQDYQRKAMLVARDAIKTSYDTMANKDRINAYMFDQEHRRCAGGLTVHNMTPAQKAEYLQKLETLEQKVAKLCKDNLITVMTNTAAMGIVVLINSVLKDCHLPVTAHRIQAGCHNLSKVIASACFLEFGYAWMLKENINGDIQQLRLQIAREQRAICPPATRTFSIDIARK